MPISVSSSLALYCLLPAFEQCVRHEVRDTPRLHYSQPASTFGIVIGYLIIPCTAQMNSLPRSPAVQFALSRSRNQQQQPQQQWEVPQEQQVTEQVDEPAKMEAGTSAPAATSTGSSSSRLPASHPYARYLKGNTHSSLSQPWEQDLKLSEQPGNAASSSSSSPASATGRGSSRTPAAAAATAPDVSGGGSGGGVENEAASIHLSNMQQLYSMSDAERSEALEEVAARLSPEMLDFLKRRGAQKTGQGAVAATEAAEEGMSGGAAAAVKGAHAEGTAGDEAGAKQGSTAAAAATGAGGAARSKRAGEAAVGMRKGFLSTTSTPASNPQQQGGDRLVKDMSGKQPITFTVTAGARGAAGPVKSAAASSSSSPSSSQLPLVAQLRFGLDGEPLSLDPKAQPIDMQHDNSDAGAAGGGGGGSGAAAGVLLRDQISRDLGLAPHGYTLQELQVRRERREAT